MAAIAAPLIVTRATEGVRVEAGYLPAIEGLRGIAVLWVMLFHYVVMIEGKLADPFIAAIGDIKPLDVLARNGYLGVELFFLITGFLLTLPWFLRAAHGEPPPSIREFYVRRFWRIAPAYYVQLAVLFFFVLPLLKGIGYWRNDLYVLTFNVVAHLSFLHNTTPLSSGSLAMNGALWTLTAEAQYYLLVPLVAPLFLRWPRSTLVVALFLAALWRQGAAHGLDTIVALHMSFGRIWSWSEATIRQLLVTQIPSYFGHFATGVLAGKAWVGWRAQPPDRALRLALYAAAVVGLALLYAVHGHLGPIFGDVTGFVPAFALGALFFAIAAEPRGARHPVLGCRPLLFTGRISYSMYLYHWIVLLLWTRYMPPIGWLSFPLYVATVFAIGWVSWRYVEVPFLRKKRLAIR
jgi:peptidoglycan/LPS O-acetylase OafA/YrhL